MIKQFLFQAIHFRISHLFHSVSMSNISIWPIDRTLSGATTPNLSGPGSNGNEGVLCIPQNSIITGPSTSNCLMSYPGHSLGGEFYPSAEMQLVYSTAQVNWTIRYSEYFNTRIQDRQ